MIEINKTYEHDTNVQIFVIYTTVVSLTKCFSKTVAKSNLMRDICLKPAEIFT